MAYKNKWLYSIYKFIFKKAARPLNCAIAMIIDLCKSIQVSYDELLDILIRKYYISHKISSFIDLSPDINANDIYNRDKRNNYH